jgi:cytochrome b561
MDSEQTAKVYDVFSITLHWLVAVFTVALFASGLWMVDLGYYDDWYYKAPWWHTGIGIVTALLVILRWCWTYLRTAPAAITSIPRWQHHIAKLVHTLMNLAIILLLITGYLVVTAKGDSLSVFDWFSIPALISLQSNTVTIAGLIHLYSAYFIITLASFHALAAIKHHVIDKDATLLRMLGLNRGEME